MENQIVVNLKLMLSIYSQCARDPFHYVACSCIFSHDSHFLILNDVRVSERPVKRKLNEPNFISFSRFFNKQNFQNVLILYSINRQAQWQHDNIYVDDDYYSHITCLADALTTRKNDKFRLHTYHFVYIYY